MEARPLTGRFTGLRGRRFRRALAGACAALGLLLMAPAAGADNDSLRSQRVKAAFILNIARFVSWPESAFDGPGAPLLLCLYRGNPLGVAIDSIRGERAVGRRMAIAEVSSYDESEACHILLVPAARLEDFSGELDEPLERPLLTVADLTLESHPEEGHRHPVMVTLVRAGTRIGYEVDLQQVRRSGLRMSAELLKLARILDTPPPEVLP